MAFNSIGSVGKRECVYFVQLIASLPSFTAGMSYLTQPLRRTILALTCLKTPPWHYPSGPSHTPVAAWACGGWRGMAGHSKWANIRHTKALKDDQKQRTIHKCIQMIKVAVKAAVIAIDIGCAGRLTGQYASSENGED
ncbi:hypothetical protein E2C01_060732 [Portunus trituberculatus]|uniref:Uncharacterized protein n=1 Tax=Portunus trituberculatus TaxID=210409 RepID=A0A5B7H8X9_PORTR|nr:hypothetical protein [Portunus trituberculatus]